MWVASVAACHSTAAHFRVCAFQHFKNITGIIRETDICILHQAIQGGFPLSTVITCLTLLLTHRFLDTVHCSLSRSTLCSDRFIIMMSIIITFLHSPSWCNSDQPADKASTYVSSSSLSMSSSLSKRSRGTLGNDCRFNSSALTTSCTFWETNLLPLWQNVR